MLTDTKICLGAKRKISPDTIIMLKSDANYTNVYLADGTKFLSSITLGILAKRLLDYNFARTSRSILVNKSCITKVNLIKYANIRPNIKLINNWVVPVSKRKVNDLQKDLAIINLKSI